MRNLVGALISSLLVIGCSTAMTRAVAAVQKEQLPGCYIRVDRLGHDDLRLQLYPDGTYKTAVYSNLAYWALASGRWELSDSTLILAPSSATSFMQEFLTELGLRNTSNNQYSQVTITPGAENPQPWEVLNGAHAGRCGF